MSRTRGERRHNTSVKTEARKAMAIRGEVDQWPAHGYCGGKISVDGEVRTCSKCDFEKNYERGYYKSLNDIRMASWYQSEEMEVE